MRKIIDKISIYLAGFKSETYLHILFTILIAAIIAKLSLYTGADRTLACYLGSFVAFAIGLAKEGWDNKVEKVFEIEDIVANAIGAILFFLIWI